VYREFLIKEPDELGDQAQMALVRSEGVLGGDHRPRAGDYGQRGRLPTGGAEFRALHRRELRGWRRWYCRDTVLQ
jgi:hypothetical protein